MIIGLLNDLDGQKCLLPRVIAYSLEQLKKLDLANTAAGCYELDSPQKGETYFTIQDVVLLSMDETKVEAHRQHADIQIPISASERFGFPLPQPDLHAFDNPLETRDLAFYPAPVDESFFTVAPGAFAVFMPGELHRPCLCVNRKIEIRKAVVKVSAAYLGL